MRLQFTVRIMKALALLIGGLLAAAAAVCTWRTPSAQLTDTPQVMPIPVATAETNHVEQPAWPTAEPKENRVVRLKEAVAALENGRKWLRSVPDYTAVFHRHERVQGVLRSPETTELKLRHQPFSVTMVWTADGKTAHYFDGMNSNRVAVRLGGWKRRLGWINLNPDGSIAMAQSRYAITDVGLMRLSEQLIEKFTPYLDAAGVSCVWLPNESIGGRLCQVFHVNYESAAVNPDYRQTTVWLDHEWNVPLCVKNFDWEQDDSYPEGLLEFYVYENLQLNSQLIDRDFMVDAPPSTSVAAAAE